MVVVATDGVAGKTTYRLTYDADPATQTNVYAMAGNADTPLSMPAAFQVASPLGADFGGVDPGMFPVLGDAEFDSWLTVGATENSAGGAIAASPGFSLSAWTETNALVDANCAVFWMVPDASATNAVPTGGGIVWRRARHLRRRRCFKDGRTR